MNAIRREAADSVIGNQHTKRHVMVKDGDVLNYLLIESQAAREPHKVRLGEEAIIKAHAAANPIAVGAEAHARHDNQIDEIYGDRLAGNWLADIGAGDGHAGLQAVNFDWQNSPLVPAYFGDDDGFVFLPT